MKIGHAEAAFWLLGREHSYCCEVSTFMMPGKRGNLFTYRWRIAGFTEWKACRSFDSGLRLARRYAESLETSRAL